MQVTSDLVSCVLYTKAVARLYSRRLGYLVVIGVASYWERYKQGVN